MTLEIRVDGSKCMGSGNCAFWAPATFDLGDDGIAVVLDAGGDPEDRVINAAKSCPTQAIFVTKDGRLL
jgi:ferredoxin